jgi:hypothetical protein
MKLTFALLIAFVLGGTPAFANPPPPTAQNIPECELVKTTDGREMCAYELEDWISVLKADALITHQQIMMGKDEERISILEEIRIDLKIQLTASTANQTLLITNNDKITHELIDLDKKYQNERVRPRWGSPLAWTVAAVSTAVLAGFVVRDLTD